MKDLYGLKILFLLLFLYSYPLPGQWMQIKGPGDGGAGGLALTTDSSGTTKLLTIANTKVYLTTDNGDSWENITSGLPEYTSILAIRGNNIFAGMCCGQGIFVSTNNGTSWTQSNSGLPEQVEIYDIFLYNNKVFAGTHHGAYCSENNGASWSPANSGLPKGCSIVAFAANETNIFAAIAWWGIYRSSDSAKSWVKLTSGLPLSFCAAALTSTGSNIFAGTDKGVFLSTDNGESWKSASAGRLDYSFIYQLAAGGKNIFAEIGLGILLSTDNGANWENITADLPINTSFSSIAISSIYIFAGSNSGLWRRPLSEITAVKDSPEVILPTGCILEQNYPNPFNPSTKIKYSVPAEVAIKLSVYNTLGEEVSVPLNKTVTAGIHEITFNADALPGGIYFYQIRAGSFIETKKMILLR